MSTKDLRLLSSPVSPISGKASLPSSPGSGQFASLSGGSGHWSTHSRQGNGSNKDFNLELEEKLLRQKKFAYDYAAKIVILGEPGVGKTTFVDAENSFDGRPGPIEGVWQSVVRQKSAPAQLIFEPRHLDNTKQNPVIRIKTRDYKYDDRIYRLAFWDCPGVESLRSQTAQLCGSSFAMFILFDLNSEASFQKVVNWLNAMNRVAPSTIRFLIGNKDNCMDRSREVSKVKAESIARLHDMIYYEIDAKTNIRCTSVFRTLFSKLIERTPKNHEAQAFQDVNVKPGPSLLADPRFRQTMRPQKNEHVSFHMNWL